MKVLVSTVRGQKGRKNDFCFVPEGEMVKFGSFECDGEDTDGTCGCRRGMVGVECSKSTTTFMVVDKPDITLKALTALLRESRRREGWDGDAGTDQAHAKRLLEEASGFAVGSVLERRGDEIGLREGCFRTE